MPTADRDAQGQPVGAGGIEVARSTQFDVQGIRTAADGQTRDARPSQQHGATIPNRALRRRPGGTLNPGPTVSVSAAAPASRARTIWGTTSAPVNASKGRVPLGVEPCGSL